MGDFIRQRHRFSSLWSNNSEAGTGPHNYTQSHNYFYSLDRVVSRLIYLIKLYIFLCVSIVIVLTVGNQASWTGSGCHSLRLIYCRMAIRDHIWPYGHNYIVYDYIVYCMW
jgi:hypothetical protein